MSSVRFSCQEMGYARRYLKIRSGCFLMIQVFMEIIAIMASKVMQIEATALLWVAVDASVHA